MIGDFSLSGIHVVVTMRLESIWHYGHYASFLFPSILKSLFSLFSPSFNSMLTVVNYLNSAKH